MSLTTILVFVVILAVLSVGRATAGKGRGVRFPYQPKAMLSRPEQVLYFRLIEALPEHIVLAQVQLSAFLKVLGRQGRQAALNRILMKSADFIICRKDFSVAVVVELQDSTHQQPKRRKSDEFKRKAFEAAGIPFFEAHVNNLPTPEELRAIPGVVAAAA